MGTIYRYVDTSDNDTIKYVGIVWSKNRSLKQRIKEHEKDAWYNEGTWRIEKLNDNNIKVNSRTDAEYLESHFIALYGTHRYFNKSKTGWGICSFVPEIDEKKWLKVKDYAEEILLEGKREELLKRLAMILDIISKEKEEKEQEAKKELFKSLMLVFENILKKKKEEEKKRFLEKILYTKGSIATTLDLMNRMKVYDKIVFNLDQNSTMNFSGFTLHQIVLNEDKTIKRKACVLGQDYEDILKIDDFVTNNCQVYLAGDYYFTNNKLFHVFNLLAKEYSYKALSPASFFIDPKGDKALKRNDKYIPPHQRDEYPPKELTMKELSNMIFNDNEIMNLYLIFKPKVFKFIKESITILIKKYENYYDTLKKTYESDIQAVA